MKSGFLCTFLAIGMHLQCIQAFAAANPQWEHATQLYNSHDYIAALSAFRKIEEKMPSDPSVHYMLGQCYKGLHNTKQAIVELEWVSTNASDPRIKGGAASLLAQLRGGGSAGAGSVRAASSPSVGGDSIRGGFIGSSPVEREVVGGPPLIPNAVSPFFVKPGAYSTPVAPPTSSLGPNAPGSRSK